MVIKSKNGHENFHAQEMTFFMENGLKNDDFSSETWRETVEDLVWQFAVHGHDDKHKWLWTGGLSALEGAFAVLGWDDPHTVEEGGCQYPGCQAWDTCGAPTPEGYKRLCSDHYRQLLPPILTSPDLVHDPPVSR